MSEDSRLMEQVKQGDHNAYETLVLKYKDSAIRYAMAMLKDEMTAQDVAQECFADLYIKRMSFTEQDSFKSFLYTLVHNRSVDMIRKRRRLVYLSDTAWTEGENNASPEALYLKKEEHRQLHDWMLHMKEDYRTALYLYAVMNLSYEEIGSKMGKTVSQVKSIIHRARKKMNQARRQAQ